MISDCLGKINAHKSVGLNRFPRMLREIAEVIPKLLSYYLGESERYLKDSQYHSSLQKGQKGRFRQLLASQPHLHSWEGDGTTCSSFHLKAIWRKRLFGVVSMDSPKWNYQSSWYVYDVITGWVAGGTAMEVVYPDFNKAFYTVSHNIFVMKLRNCGIAEWTVR